MSIPSSFQPPHAGVDSVAVNDIAVSFDGVTLKDAANVKNLIGSRELIRVFLSDIVKGNPG